ncbi:MAG: phosphodiester glycosidase family protein [Muribaculaceae bacterium]|nr:phosphodiester glycosidase family protein [Muribaculaceae bacterium]
MSKLPKEINDDEIRIISSDKKLSIENKSNIKPSSNKLRREGKLKWNKLLILCAIIFIGGLAVFFWWEIRRDTESDDKESLEIITQKEEKGEGHSINYQYQNSPHSNKDVVSKGFVQKIDTVINNEEFTVFKPKNLTPELIVGEQILQDSTTIFAVQAADIRKDNGGIVGAYVYKGDLLSKGQAKAGFCAIIKGKPIIGIAETTPYLEEAIETDGYFFRQYPLVVEGQAVDNRINYSSLRKALGEINGEIVVIMSHTRLTLNEFARYLVDLGVKNAIYLVGSTSYGFAIDEKGNKIEFGVKEEEPYKNTNYIVWK